MRANAHIVGMDALFSNRFALPTAVASILLLTFAVPALRLRLREGSWGIVFHRHADPFQAAIGTAMGVCVAAIVAGTAIYAAIGAEGVGAWTWPAWTSRLGWALIVTGVGVTVVAQWQMGRSWRIGIDDRPTPLVTRGLFAFVRNPIFTAMIIVLAGGVLVVPSVASIALWLGTVLVLAFQSRLEEIHLVTLHGDAYRAYAARVGRFWPGVGRLT